MFLYKQESSKLLTIITCNDRHLASSDTARMAEIFKLARGQDNELQASATSRKVSANRPLVSPGAASQDATAPHRQSPQTDVE